MPPLTIDGKVHPDEYEVRVDSGRSIHVVPPGSPVFIEVYYSFDGAALHFGIRRTQGGIRVTGVSIWIDPDRNGCEVGDLLIAVAPPDRLIEYGVFDLPGKVNGVAGSPPDPWRAGVEVKSVADGDTEVKLVLARQYANGLTPSPLPAELNVNVTVSGQRADGSRVVNFLRDAPIKTFVMSFE